MHVDQAMLVRAVIAAVIGVALSPLVLVLARRLTHNTHAATRTREARAGLSVACGVAGVAVATLGGPWTMTLYGLFAAAAVAAAAVDRAERRIPDRITYPLGIVAVCGLPWLNRPVTGWSFAAPLLGGAAAFGWAFLSALIADQGLGDVKLSAAIGAWLGHFGVLAVLLGVVLGQVAVVVAVITARRRAATDPAAHTPLGPALVAGAVAAIALTGMVTV